MYLALAGKVLYCAVSRKVELTVGVTTAFTDVSVTDVSLNRNVGLEFCL